MTNSASNVAIFTVKKLMTLGTQHCSQIPICSLMNDMQGLEKRNFIMFIWTNRFKNLK